MSGDHNKKGGIPVSKTLKIIKSPKSLKNIRWGTLPETFVIKATHGTLGRGILIVFGKRKKGETRRLKTKRWIQADGKPITIDNIKNKYGDNSIVRSSFLNKD